MAFPTGYTKYQEITIDHTKVPGDLTDFIVYVNLADLVKGGADIFDTCRTDGGDIRATKSDGTTQLATELVAIDTTAKTGELHIKFTGTLSSSSDTIIRIYYNGSDTALATTDTYGRNAVWSAYKFVLHMRESSGSPVDSTGNYSPSYVGNLPNKSTSLPMGGGQDLDGVADYINMNAVVFSGDQDPLVFQTWVNMDTLANENSQNSLFGEFRTNGANNDTRNFFYMESDGSLAFDQYLPSGGLAATANGTIATSTTYLVHMVKNSDSISFYKDGAIVGSAISHTETYSGGSPALSFIGARNLAPSGTISDEINGRLGEFRSRVTTISANWITTEYNNQNSPSTFYSTGNEVGSGSAYNQDLEETVTITDTVIRGAGKQLEEVATITDTIRRATTKVLAETTTITDAGQRLLVKLIGTVDNLTVTDTMSRAIGKVITETATITETVRRAITRSLTESTTITDVVSALTATYSKLIAETITITDTFSRVVGYARTFTETINVTDRLRAALNGINAFWKNIYNDTADEWANIYQDN